MQIFKKLYFSNFYLSFTNYTEAMKTQKENTL